MNPQLAKHVHQVIGYAIDLKERAEKGEALSVAQEQSTLRGLLNGPNELQVDASYFGEAGGNPRMTQDRFLGAKYALTCWIDEVFILDSPYGKQWQETSLEYEIFKLNDRAEGFWQQSHKAEQRAGTDALEVYYWCVQLGFRGNYADRPAELKTWTDAVRSRIVRTHREEIKLPVDQGFVTDVPQLVGEDRFATMVRFVAGAILFLVPVLVYLALSAMK